MSEEKKENYIEVECPHCEYENKIKLSNDISCKECKKTLVGFKYKSFLVSTAAALTIGAGGGATGDTFLNLFRPPVKTEYKMMKQCIDKYGYSKSVRNNCLCAVESMAGVVDAQKARYYGSSWLEDVLDDKYMSCKD